MPAAIRGPLTGEQRADAGPAARWTPEMDALLRREWPACADTKALARVMGRSYSALKNRATALGVVRGRDGWTEEEDEVLRANYRTRTGPELAAELGRSPMAVYRRAELLGLSRPSHRWTAAEDAELRRLHGLGHNDHEISTLTGHKRLDVSERRRRLGLPAQGYTPRVLAAMSERAKRQIASGTVPANLRALAWRRAVAARGWPETISPRAAQVLEGLCDRGPATAAQLRARLGLRGGFIFHANGRNGTNSLFRSLERDGLLHVVARAVKGEGNRRHDLYFPSADAIARRRAFLEGREGP